jgi:drug/metabolite transporter (DMT)-like permease
LNEIKLLPITSLLFAAILWGLIWYPYRLLQNTGVGGEVSTLVTYLLALGSTSLLFARAWREFGRAPIAMAMVAIASGWCNLSYVLGILNGEVMRVLLLFYLAPLWTVPLARVILKEHITGVGYVVVFLALCGAMVMLWNPSLGLPIPSTKAEWLGLSSGFSFALANVSVRRAKSCGVAVKALSTFLGVALAALIAVSVKTGGAAQDFAAAYNALPLVGFVGVMLVAMGFATNYGLTHVPATRAIVIMLFELVIAALASYFLAGEVMGVKEWIGGTMIVAASLFSGHIKEKGVTPEQVPALG